jgi:hypothetical protein
MILTDTTVVIDFLRAPTVHLVKIIQTNQAAICGATLSEVYAGARSSADFKKYDKVLSIVFTPAHSQEDLAKPRTKSCGIGQQRHHGSFSGCTDCYHRNRE